MTDGDSGRVDPAEPFAIVAIASSAGGITALTRVLGGLPNGFPVPVVVVQHLDPRHTTVIAEVLGRRDEDAGQARAGGRGAEPGTIYIAPPNHHLLIEADGVLTLSSSELVHFVRPSADLLFESVAGSYGPRAIACVLTGTGNDGAMGASAIKSRGGTVIAEDPELAEFKSMPEAAVADRRGRLHPAARRDSRSDPRARRGGPVMTQPDTGQETDSGLEDLLVFIRDSRGFDFTGYKRSTVARRIRKRMHEAGATDYTDYRDLLESSAEEFGHLFNTILINVTGFFRDPETWTFLQREIMPELIAEAERTAEIRVWSAGCASGEEAYSLAMAFAEALGVDECAKRVKIYATDLDDEALRDARAGLYQAKALDSLADELKDKYFEKNGTQFAFRTDLRRRVIFGRHDITRDAPISRLDLLVCRNTLMYFNVETQSHVIDRFHFAVREGGYLFLGKAEMLISDGNRFEVVSMRQRIFRRRPGTAAPRFQSVPMRPDAVGGPEVREASRKRQLQDLALETAPFAVIGLDAEGNVVLLNDADADHVRDDRARSRPPVP